MLVYNKFQVLQDYKQVEPHILKPLNKDYVTLNEIFIRKKNGSTEHSKGNKTVPEKVATTRTEDGHK
jgi:hypothetical protein